MRTDAKPDIEGFSEESLTHAGTRIRYLAGGSGPPIVLVHGLGGMAANWRLVAPRLAATHRVIVPDLPGHGSSSPLESAPGSLDPFAEAVLAVAELEGALPAPWIGHSMGGLVALRAAVLRPEAVTGAVLAAAAGITSASRVGQVTVTLIGVAKPGRIIGRRRRRIARSRVGRTLAFWWGVADPAALDPAMAESFLAGPTRHTDTLTAGKALVVSDPRRDLHRVTCPCLCLWGTNDTWVPLADGMEYARRLRAPLRTIADCGHLLIGERPDVVERAIREFLDSL